MYTNPIIGQCDWDGILLWHLSPIDLARVRGKNNQKLTTRVVCFLICAARFFSIPVSCGVNDSLVLEMSQLVTKQIQVSTVVSCYLSIVLVPITSSSPGPGSPKRSTLITLTNTLLQ